MNLVIFDIDGTLTNTNQIDETCFVNTLASEFGFIDINSNWSEYQNITDSGITQQIFQERLQRQPSELEIKRFKLAFVAKLQQEISTQRHLFSSIPGAEKVLAELQTSVTWRVAIATGGWYDSAILKLQAADLAIHNIPLASSDDGISREDIINAAILKAKNNYKVEDFTKIVFVGDGIWDIKAARNLNISFIGIANHQAPEKLLDAGAKSVLQNFDNCDFTKLLDTAEVPKSNIPFLLHITQRLQWEQAKDHDIYIAESLAKEGFIHCSKVTQIIPVANRFFYNQKELVILLIDSQKVKAEIRYEAAETGEIFPHIYGNLNIDAVTQVIDFASGVDGYFDLPQQLQDLLSEIA
ncbi:DUF952 domain-containing protein [Aulosira sp. FACHB-615]|uniref:DUF952 domain-containing protein n=1 Tax=Aulosira sp. FACHB-615 TaxID=2692777 RepID=UPI001683F07D|nr:DUF952 domain-containing protein [Aulosira sp. FACHB-615]MBD2486956.1 DUF952 domain-containing protein [Aulosira sp. FACHB-615]